jgi:hypothetical protein
MTLNPKEKAKELKDKFSVHLRFFDEYSGWVDYTDSSHAKQFALIAVDELIKSHYLLTTTHDIKPSMRCKSYWKQVKHEIENL